MTLREYRPINAALHIPKPTINQVENDLNGLWQLANVKPYHCLRINGFTIIKNAENKNKSLMTIKPEDKQNPEGAVNPQAYIQNDIILLRKEINETTASFKK